MATPPPFKYQEPFPMGKDQYRVLSANQRTCISRNMSWERSFSNRTGSSDQIIECCFSRCFLFTSSRTQPDGGKNIT